MKKQGVVVAVAIVIALVGMAWYLGWQVHQAQLARVASFASYYQVLNGYLQSTNHELQQFIATDSEVALADCVSDMQTVERMAFPLSGLAPKTMSSFWTDFLDHNWNAVTKSFTRLATQNAYFGSGRLPDSDQDYLNGAAERLQAIAELMDAPTVSEGVAPGVRIRLDQLVKMNDLADELVALADCYVANGLLPTQLPPPRVSWQEAENTARQALSLPTSEWRLIGSEQSVQELRQAHDYYLLHFEPTTDYQGEMRTVEVGIDRQNGQLVGFDWGLPNRDGEPTAPTDEELQQWALTATDSLPGPKAVLDMVTANESEPTAVVVPLQSGIPVLCDYVLLGFDSTTGTPSKWENYSWGTVSAERQPRLTEATASNRLIALLDLDPAALASQGLAVVRSPYTGQPTLVYWFSYQGQDAQGQPRGNEFFVNARNGKLERTGSGW